MKAFKKLQAAAVLGMVITGVPVTSMAGWQETIGAVVGAGLGNQVGGGNGKTIATVVGGIAGYEAGGALKGKDTNYASGGYNNDSRSDGPSTKEVLGTIGGGAVGAVLGNQVGGGRGKTVMTVVGGIAGAMVGKHLTKDADDFVMRDAQGRSWKNGHLPMDPQTELPSFRRSINQVQQDYANYVDAANRASAAKNDKDWRRISDNEYYQYQRAMNNAGSQFNQSRSELNNMASTITTTYDKKIDIDHLLVIASCNAIPVGYGDTISYQSVVAEGKHCSPAFKPNL